MRRTVILCGLVAALAGLIVLGWGCSKSTPNEPIVIGGIFSITGPASYLGEPERNSMEMVVAEVTDKGGVNWRPQRR